MEFLSDSYTKKSQSLNETKKYIFDIQKSIPVLTHSEQHVCL